MRRTWRVSEIVCQSVERAPKVPLLALSNPPQRHPTCKQVTQEELQTIRSPGQVPIHYHKTTPYLTLFTFRHPFWPAQNDCPCDSGAPAKVIKNILHVFPGCNLRTMGMCMSSDAKLQRAQSLEIDRQLACDAQRHKRESKILLLGAGESGKSTIMKQIKIIHQNGYITEELLSYRSTIWRNLVESVVNILDAMDKLEMQFVDQVNKVCQHRNLNK